MTTLLAQMAPGAMATIVIAVVVLFVLLIVLAVFANYFRLWIQSFLTGAGISIWDLIGMTFRKVNKDVIVKTKIMAVQAGLSDPEITSKSLEAHYLSGGNVPLVIRSLIAANKAKTIKLSYREATAIDLAGRNVLEAVQTSVYPTGSPTLSRAACAKRRSAACSIGRSKVIYSSAIVPPMAPSTPKCCSFR